MKKVISLPVFLILFTLIISSCSTSKSGSAFQKRRYTKGWYVNLKSPFNKKANDVNTKDAELALESSSSITPLAQMEIQNDLKNQNPFPSPRAIKDEQPAKKKLRLENVKSIFAGIDFQRILPSNTASTSKTQNQEITTSQKTTLLGMQLAGRDGFAVAGFICSIIGIFVPFLAVLGIIFSAIGLNSNRHGLALAGLIIGIVALAVPFLIWF